MSAKFFYDTKLGTYKRDRDQSEVKAQREYEYRLQAEARRTVARLRQKGRRVVVHYSDSFNAANRGLCVLPTPRLTEDGFTAWTCR